jgi:hypothetical protein
MGDFLIGLRIFLFLLDTWYSNIKIKKLYSGHKPIFLKKLLVKPD